MARRDPFAHLKQAPSNGAPAPIDLIPRPKKRTRRREWEKANPAHTYKIPVDFHDRAKAVREALLGLAQQYQSTVDDVARALMTAALKAVQVGEIQLGYRPNPKSRKMTVEVVRESGWPQEELPKPNPRKKVKPMVLNFRWGEDTHKALTDLAADVPKGAVVVLLLEAALERVKAGKWGIRPRPVAVKQQITVANSWKKKG